MEGAFHAARAEVRPEELARISFFARLTPAERALVAGCARREVAPAGLAITALGERGDDHFYVIEAGRARVTQESERLGELGPGDFFGEIALLGSEWRTATVQATTTMHLICLSKRLLDDVLAAEPELAERLAAAARERLARSDHAD